MLGGVVGGLLYLRTHERRWGVGQVEREALDRVRERLAALRRDQYRLLEDIADLQRLGVAQQTGDRFTERLLQDLGRLNRRDADRLVDETADLVPQLSLSGEPLPPRLPCTATVYAGGEIGPGHVAVIRRTMTRLDKAAVDPADWVWAESTLAHDGDPAVARTPWRRRRRGCWRIWIRTGRPRTSGRSATTSC